MLDWIATTQATHHSSGSSQADETDRWMTKQKEAEASIHQLRADNARVNAQLDEANRKNEDLTQDNERLKSLKDEDDKTIQQLKDDRAQQAGAIQQLSEDNNRLNGLLETLRSKRDDDTTAQHLNEENARLTTLLNAKVDEAIKFKEENVRLAEKLESSSNLASQLDEKLLIYQSKCAELESSLHQHQALAHEKAQLYKQLQEQKEQLENEAAQARSLAESLQLKLDQTERNKTSTEDKGAVVEQVKAIMNKTYKQALKQFRPEESYSFQSIKSSLSGVIRVKKNHSHPVLKKVLWPLFFICLGRHFSCSQ